MNLSRTRRRLSISVFVMSLLFLAAACGGESAMSAPTPEPELSLSDLLSSAGEKLAALSTAKFKMIDEKETGAKFFANTLKTVNGEIKAPDSVRMLVGVEAPGLGFVEIEIMAVGDQAFMKFFKDAPWVPLPRDQVPFNFGGIGVTLSELLPVMKDVAIVGRESVGGAQTIRIDGNVVSEEMSALITSVDSGHAITLTLWVDEVEHVLRQFRIAGQLFDDDAPETSRLVTMDIDRARRHPTAGCNRRSVSATRTFLTSKASSESVVLGIICLGVFSTALDQTVVVAALPSVMVDLEIPLTDLDTASWIVTGYLISYTVAMPLAGRLSDVHGRVRMFQAALVVFSIGSALVAVAPNFPWIVSARVLQAFGGGATVPIGLAMAVAAVSPQKRGVAIGLCRRLG